MPYLRCLLDVLTQLASTWKHAHFHERLYWMSFHFKCLAFQRTLHDTESHSVSGQCAETAHTQLCLSLHPSCVGFALRPTVRLPGTIGVDTTVSLARRPGINRLSSIAAFVGVSTSGRLSVTNTLCSVESFVGVCVCAGVVGRCVVINDFCGFLVHALFVWSSKYGGRRCWLC